MKTRVDYNAPSRTRQSAGRRSRDAHTRPRPHGIEAGGSWDQLELIALAGSFALLSRRRGDTYLKLALAGVISGPHH
ncbi:hypothetical protein [Streptomyces sp. NPDC092903]|uniref:hypothetical protein n=1 Tax=Streptomyces sp. NPDC092903 TaxID=3366017 RepID=UPI0038105BE0